MKYPKVAIAVSCCFLLNVCLEVEDSSNDELVDTLQAQNEILIAQQVTNTVAINGLVINAKDGQAINNASITVKRGAVIVAENISVTNASFELDGLSPDSDLEIIVSSADDQFMQRVFYVNTGSSTSGEAFKDMGEFQVSEALNLETSALKSADNMPFDTLEFEASLVSGSGSTSHGYKHLSTFTKYQGSIPSLFPVTFRLL
jgi:hypothetical protein